MRVLGYFAFASLVGVLMGATAEDHRPAIIAAGQVPLSFERASAGSAHWMARGNGYRLAVGAADIEVGLSDEQLRIQFVGGNARAESAGLDALPGKVNYLIGRDPKAWLCDIPTFARVRYKGVYPGVDMVWYGRQGRLEYDLDIQPGADAGKIAMRFEGARKLSLEANGDLRVEMAGGSLSLKLPEVFQVGSNGRQRIASGYELRAGNEVGFHLAAYDKARPLVIDPTLVYATYFGSGEPAVRAVTVDASGNVYIAGVTSGSVIPVVSAVQARIAGPQNAFISKFDPTGKAVLYSTYLGGSRFDFLRGIAVDSTTGDLVGTGQTESPDFPLMNAVKTAIGANSSGFAFKLNSAGDGLVYSTYLPGNSSGFAVALDTSGNAYFTGGSGSHSIPTTSGALNNCCTFVVKLSSTGGEVYAASIGATGGRAIAVDALGAAYVAGYSTASSFPNNPPGARTTNSGGNGDAFVAKLSPDATSLVWATFLGGSGGNYANAVALGTGNVVYFGGLTQSADLPVTAGAVQGTYGGGEDSFVASLSADGTAFGFVTYLGGGRDDWLNSLAVGTGGLIVAGTTTSRDFPIGNAVQPAFPGSPYALFRSTDSGASFAGADNGLPSPWCCAGVVLPDPSVAGTILMDTGQGVFRSTNDGATWANVVPISNGSTARSLSNPSVLYAPGTFCLYKSTDGGQTWSSMVDGCALNATLIGISPTDPNTVLGFGGNTEQISTDGGATFPQVITTPFFINSSFYEGPPGLFGAGQILASPDGSVYAAAPQYGLFKSTDVGLTWTQLGSGLVPANITGFSLSSSNASVLYAADGSNVYKSTNAGAVWSTVGPGAGVSYLTVDPSNAQHVYGSSYGGVIFTSSDGGATWTPTGAYLDSYYIPSFVVSPSNAAELYVGNYVPGSGFVSKLSTDGKTLLWSTYYGGHGYSWLGGAALAPAGDVWVAGYAESANLPLTPNARNGNTSAGAPAFLARITDATASCAYTINPATQYSYSAGGLAFSVTAPSGCAWTATPSDSWIHVIRASGTGSGTIPLSVDGNTTASTRNGTVNVNGQTYTIVQPSSTCTYQLSSPSLTSAGGTASITVTAPAGCPWDVELQSSDPAAVTSASTGTGSGTVTVSVPPSAGVNSPFYGVQIGGSSTYISEASACLFSFPSGTTIAVPADALQYSIQINANLNGCNWDASTDQPGWLTLNNNSSGSGVLNYDVAVNNTGVARKARITVGAQQVIVGGQQIIVGGQQITVTQDFTSVQFADIPPSAAFFDAVNLMFQAGVTNGCVPSSSPSTRMFCPNDSVTREEMAAFIVRAVTGTLTPAIYNPVPLFTDVPTTNPFFPHIQKMEELGITAGCGGGLFCPLETIPRWEMAIFVIRARLALYGTNFTSSGIPYFADVPTNVEGNGIAFPFIQRAYEEHVTNGCGTNPLIYCPDELVTRGQMAAFIMRALFNETTILGSGAPILTGVSPNTMASTVGTQILVTITGVNTNFQAGDTVTVPSGMLAVSGVVISSATSITATLTANSNVVVGPQTLVVTSGGQNLTLPLAIKVGTY